MKSRARKFSVITICIAIMSFGLQVRAWAGVEDFDRIFFFGDSLSDAGNVFAITGETAQSPYEVIPSRPYDFDGYQFSNGKTWTQWFARHLEQKRSGQASLFARGVNGNYAFGGARARLTNDPYRAPSSREQLGLFLQDHSGAIDAEALYVIQFGGNDIRDAIAKFFEVVGSDPNNPDIFGLASQQAGLIIQAAIEANIGMISALYNEGQGAKHFLVATAPDLGVTPAVRGLGLDAAMIASMISASYNNGLQAGLEAAAALPGISIETLDLSALLGDIIADPQSYGIDNATSPCLIFIPNAEGSVQAWSYCRKPNRYVFWDGIHPTAKVHKILSEAAESIYR